MHVDGFEPGAIEGGRHLDLPVHPLLAQDRDARARAAAGAERRGDVLVRIERQMRRQAGIVGTHAAGLLLVGAGRIVAQRLHRVRRLRPEAAQEAAALLEQQLARPAQRHAVVGARRARGARTAAPSPWRAERGDDPIDVGRSDGDHGAQLLGKERRDGIGAERGEIDVQPDAAGEGHLEQRHQEAAVAAVVVGGQQAGRVQLLDRREEPDQAGRIVEVGRRRAERAVDLRQRRAAEPILPDAEIDRAAAPSDPPRRAISGVSTRRTSVTGANAVTISDSGAVTAARFVVRLPARAHRERVLADRDGDPERRAELDPDGADGVVEPRVLAGVAGRGHPVGRQLHVGEASRSAPTRCW